MRAENELPIGRRRRVDGAEKDAAISALPAVRQVEKVASIRKEVRESVIGFLAILVDGRELYRRPLRKQKHSKDRRGRRIQLLPCGSNR